jgi:hypothetical protein
MTIPHALKISHLLNFIIVVLSSSKTTYCPVSVSALRRPAVFLLGGVLEFTFEVRDLPFRGRVQANYF